MGLEDDQDLLLAIALSKSLMVEREGEKQVQQSTTGTCVVIDLTNAGLKVDGDGSKGGSHTQKMLGLSASISQSSTSTTSAKKFYRRLQPL